MNMADGDQGKAVREAWHAYFGVHGEGGNRQGDEVMSEEEKIVTLKTIESIERQLKERWDQADKVDKLIAAATLCANCCYNISRNFSYDLPDHVRESMQRSQKTFNEALHELRQSRKS